MDDRIRAAEPDLRVLSALFAAGVLAAHALPRLPPAGLVALLALTAALRWRGRLLWAPLVLGFCLAVVHGQDYLDQRWPASRHGTEVELDGRVASLVERKTRAGRDSGEPEATLRFEFEPADPSYPRRIRASWYRADALPRGGECWTLRLRLRTPHGSSNPDSFDYEGWLYRRGVGAVATVREGRRCAQPRSESWVLAMRQHIAERIEAALGAHAGRDLVAALSIGDSSGFDAADWDAFRQTGTSHLVAISGFNVAILAGLAFLLVRWSWPLWPRLALALPAQKAGMIAAALAGLAYSLLAGWESPAQRAALMLALLLLAALPSRRAQASRVLALALLLMLAFDPAVVLSPGLWLSYGAVAAIYFLSTGRLRAAPAWSLALRLQLMLSLVLAPLSLYFFHGAAWLGPLVNLVAVPLMALLTPLVVLALGLALVAPGVGALALQGVAELLVWGQAGLSWLAAEVPGAWIPAAPPLSALLLALLGSLLLFAPRGLPLRPLAVVCLLPLLFPPRSPVTGPFEVTALDVGQGLSVVVRTAHHTLLYDAGPAFEDGFDAGESVVAPYLLGRGLRRIDHLMLSHGDSDHAGGVPAVRRLVRVAQESGTPGHPPCEAGQHWEWDGVRFEVLHPDAQTWSDNNRSCVLRVSAPGLSALLAGDIERAAEARLLERGRDALRADILLAPHHGSRTSSTPDFVAAVAPAHVVFSAGWRSHYRHPRPEVVARYAEVGARTHVTGVEGAVRLWRDPAGELRSQAWRPGHQRFWSAAAEP